VVVDDHVMRRDRDRDVLVYAPELDVERGLDPQRVGRPHVDASAHARRVG